MSSLFHLKPWGICFFFLLHDADVRSELIWILKPWSPFCCAFPSPPSRSSSPALTDGRPSVHKTATVDLLGSWDNFSTPYPMQHDNQKGHGCWYGCFSFDHIICDGDPSNCSMPRQGNLKEAGTYWYYVGLPGSLRSVSQPRNSN